MTLKAISDVAAGNIIYKTTYKKGWMVNDFCFAHPGPLPEAVEKVKTFCTKRHIKHLHTVPLLINLDEDENTEGINSI